MVIKVSKIEELLKNEKVEWKKLGEVCEIKTGQAINKNKIEKNKGIYPVINSGKDPLGYINIWNTEDDPIGITSRGAGVGSITYQPGKFYRGNLNYAVTIKDKRILKIRFLYHLLYNLQEDIHKLCSFNGIPALNASELKTLEIPIPYIETQEKIVNILDNFTNYVTELQVELQARNKQYSYYRDMLLSEEYLNKISEKLNNSAKKYELRKLTIEEIVKIKNGKDWKTLGQGNIPVYGSGGKMDIYVNKYSYNRPTVLIPRKGTIENIFYVDEPFWNVDTIFYTEIDETKIKPKYFYYFMKTIDLKALSINSTRPSLTQSILSKIEIKLPSLEIQNKVVEVLDRFQELIENSRGLLPEEIEKRQKQYEYYREKLLTFDKMCDSIPHSAFRNLIPKCYFDILKEACDIVGLKFLEVEWKKLKDIGVFENGTGMPKSLFKKNGSVGAIHYGHIYTKYNLFVDKPYAQVSEDNIEKLKKVNYGDLVIAKTSENVDDVMKTVAYLGDKVAVTGGHAAIFRHNQNPKYLSYVFNGADYLLRQKNKFARGVKVIELSINEMEKIKIPLPSIIVQNYVVSILDKFDKFVNDVNEGLPKEIDLRQKEYEYYREKLLDFPKN